MSGIFSKTAKPDDNTLYLNNMKPPDSLLKRVGPMMALTLNTIYGYGTYGYSDLKILKTEPPKSKGLFSCLLD